MEERTFDRSGQHASVIGLGTWQLGADWGDVDNKEALAVLEAAAESGVTFFDTADVYGDGRSEQTIASFLSGRPDLHVLVATKMGRRVDQIPENYVLDNFRAWNDRSRRNLGVDRIDLVQLHCPPTPVYSTDEVFDALDTLVEEERIAAYGVSVETSAEALTAIARPNVASVQIILNPFRMKPLREVLPAAREAGVGIIARVPLASPGAAVRQIHQGHRLRGERPPLVQPARRGLRPGRDLLRRGLRDRCRGGRRVLGPGPEGCTPAQLALRWIIQQPGVTTVIPGARSPEQARANAAAARLPELSDATLTAIADLYDRRIREQVEGRW